MAVLPSPELSRADTLSGIDPVVPGGGDEDDYDNLPNTRRIDALELLGTAVDRAYSAGRPDIAERLLADHLRDVLHEARVGRPLPPSVVETALEHSLRLARETRRGGWLDYAIELLSVRRIPPPLGVLRGMAGLGQRLDHVNLPLFGEYLQMLEREHPRFGAAESEALAEAQQVYAQLQADLRGH